MDIIAAKRTLVCQIGDYDANDKYLFQIDSIAPDFQFQWKLKGCGDHGRVKVTKKALDSGLSLIGFSQGSVSRWKGAVAEDTRECKNGCDCHTPPFLLSKAAFDTLKSGTPVELNVFGEIATFKPKGRKAHTVEIDGKKTKLDCLRAVGGGAELWVAEQGGWPLLVRAGENDDGPSSELLVVSDQTIKQVEAGLGDDED